MLSNTVNRTQITSSGEDTFNYLFKILDQDDIEVTGTLDGVDTVYTISVDYTVTGVGADAGGTVVFGDAPETGTVITLRRVMDYEQLTDLVTQGGLDAEVIEEMADRLTMYAQQGDELLGRALVVPVSDTLDLSALPSETERANAYLAFDGDGQPVASGGTPGSTPVSVFMEDVLSAGTAVAARTALMTPDLVTHAPVNVQLVASVAANALTIALKGHDGNDHSATNIGYLPFRDPTLNNGAVSVLALTGPLSVTLPSGATLGRSNNIPFRVWIAVFLDGSGNPVLSVINPTVGGNVVAQPAYIGAPVLPSGRASSTVMSVGSDGAAIWYGQSLTDRPYTLLGFCTYPSGLATAGAYNVAPTGVQPWVAGMPLPGSVIKTARLSNDTVVTGTTTITLDDNTPTATSWGNSLFGVGIVTDSPANIHRVRARFPVAHSSTPVIIAGLLHVSGNDSPLEMTLSGRDATNNAASLVDLFWQGLAQPGTPVYTGRVGATAAGTITANGHAGASLFSASLRSEIHIEEIMG